MAYSNFYGEKIIFLEFFDSLSTFFVREEHIHVFFPISPPDWIEKERLGVCLGGD